MVNGANINKTWHKAFLGGMGFNFIQIQRHAFSKGEILLNIYTHQFKDSVIKLRET